MDRVHIGHVVFNISDFDCGIQIKVYGRQGKACCARNTAARKGLLLVRVTKLQSGIGVTSSL